MFVCRPENPILTEAWPRSILWIFRYANKHIDRKQKYIIVLLYNAVILINVINCNTNTTTLIHIGTKY